MRLFEATRSPRDRAGDEWIEINRSWGRCQVKGKLGQRHADLLEAILYYAEAQREVGGGIEILVDPHKIRAAMSSSRYSYEHINDLIADMTAVVIKIYLAGDNDPIVGGIIDHKRPSKKFLRPDPRSGTIVASDDERAMWEVRLGVAMVELLKRDLPRYYDPAPLARLRYAVSQAVARHVLSHHKSPAGGWKLDTLIGAACGDLAGQALRDARRRIRADADGLRAAGVEVDPDTGRVSIGSAKSA